MAERVTAEDAHALGWVRALFPRGTWQQAALRMLGVMHGPPIGNGDARRVYRWAEEFWRVQLMYERDRPKATCVRVQGGPVLWRRT